MTTKDEAQAIRVRGLRKVYGDRAAVDGLELDVATGEVFALLGPNGAGKTTTVEILEGYRRRDGGDVRVLGVDPASGGPGWRAGIGIVLQSSAENAELTVAETVAHFARYYPDPRDPDEVIEAVGLTDKSRSRTRSLSGGQRRRLDVALGIVGRPRLLFLDEPTTGFDPQARRSFWELVRSLRGDGTTILLTTHYLDEAEQLADRIAILHEGRIIVNGTLAELQELLGPPKLEYVEKKPTLEDVYFAVVGGNGNAGGAAAVPAPSDGQAADMTSADSADMTSKEH